MCLLNIPNDKESKFFHINSANRTVIGNKMSEFVQQKIIEISFKDKSENSLVFNYSLKAQKMDGTATIHKWTSDMDNLQANLLLVTDLEGNFKDILDFENLYSKWKSGYKETLKFKYADFQPGLDIMLEETTKMLRNKEQFVNNFVGYSSWRFFFQSWYKKHEIEEKNSLILNGYFGKIDLPLYTSSNYFTSENGISVERRGELDKEKFDRKGFARMLKDLTHVYNIDASLKVDMEEKYEMGKDGYLQEAELFLDTSVTNWYSVATAHQLKRLNSEEFLSFIEQIRDKENKIIASE